MKVILSPAKNIVPHPMPGLPLTRPRFLAQTETLCAQLKNSSPWQLESLLSVNPELALRAYQDFQQFSPELPGTAALLSYHGLQYQQLDAGSLSLEELAFAQECLRPLSAFYGVLRPCDGILPHRLEFFSRLRLDGKTLYQFWGDLFYQDLFSHGEPVVNLASAEYAKAVFPHLRPGDRFICCDFLVFRKGKRCTVATWAKMARGQLARWIVKNQAEQSEQLKEFCWQGFTFVPSLSSDTHYVFLLVPDSSAEIGVNDGKRK